MTCLREVLNFVFMLSYVYRSAKFDAKLMRNLIK